MKQRTFASDGPSLGAVGLGCMGMSWGYAESGREDSQSADVIAKALDAGVNMIDTADIYGDGHNETVVGRGIEGRRDRTFLATKCGLVVDDLPQKRMHRDGTPAHVKAAVRESLQRLKVDSVDLIYLHRIDDNVPLAETWGAMAELVNDGLVQHLGLSEVSVAQAAEAHTLHPVSAIQSELSLWTRDALGQSHPTDGTDNAAAGEKISASGDVVGWCATNGATFVPFAPLGRGFLTGSITTAAFESNDFRATNPRFSGGALTQNLRIVDVVKKVAARHEASAAQVAIAWTLAQGHHVVPIPGTRNQRHLGDNVGAAELTLTSEDLSLLSTVPATVGARY